MNILVTKKSTTSSFQFQFIRFEGDDESMKDYAKMAILLPIQEYPDDDAEKSYLFVKKFEKRYGDIWSCGFIKEGGVVFFFYDIFISIKNND